MLKLLRNPWIPHGILAAIVLLISFAALLDIGYSLMGAFGVTSLFAAIALLTVKIRCGRIF